jgi:hypothetical protein
MKSFHTLDAEAALLASIGLAEAEQAARRRQQDNAEFAARMRARRGQAPLASMPEPEEDLGLDDANIGVMHPAPVPTTTGAEHVLVVTARFGEVAIETCPHEHLVAAFETVGGEFDAAMTTRAYMLAFIYARFAELRPFSPR